MIQVLMLMLLLLCWMAVVDEPMIRFPKDSTDSSEETRAAGARSRFLGQGKHYFTLIVNNVGKNHLKSA